MAADLRQFGGVIELAELGVDLVRHLAFVEAAEAGHGILATRIVRRDDHDVLVALVLHDLADGFVQIVVLPGDIEEEGVALLAGVLRRAGIGRDVEGLVLEDGRADGKHDVGEDDASHEVDLVLLQELVGCLLSDIGALLVVGDNDLSRQVAELAVQVLDAELETVADVHAEAGARAGQGGHQTDLDLVGGMRGTSQQQGSGKGSQARHHRNLRAVGLKREIVAQEQADTVAVSSHFRVYSRPMMKPAVVLLSGGLDSATCLAIARSQGFRLLLPVLRLRPAPQRRTESGRARGPGRWAPRNTAS